MSVHLLAFRPEDIQALNLRELEAKMIKLIWYLIPKLLGTRWHLLMNNNPHRAVQVITVIFLLLLYSVHRLWLDLLDPKERGWVTPIAINVEVAAAWSDAIEQHLRMQLTALSWFWLMQGPPGLTLPGTAGERGPIGEKVSLTKLQAPPQWVRGTDWKC